jgi:uncharacterized membrane protein
MGFCLEIMMMKPFSVNIVGSFLCIVALEKVRKELKNGEIEQIKLTGVNMLKLNKL